MIAPHVQRLASEGKLKIGMPNQTLKATLNSLLGMARPRLRFGNARNHAPACWPEMVFSLARSRIPAESLREELNQNPAYSANFVD